MSALSRLLKGEYELRPMPCRTGGPQPSLRPKELVRKTVKPEQPARPVQSTYLAVRTAWPPTWTVTSSVDALGQRPLVTEKRESRWTIQPGGTGHPRSFRCEACLVGQPTAEHVFRHFATFHMEYIPIVRSSGVTTMENQNYRRGHSSYFNLMPYGLVEWMRDEVWPHQVANFIISPLMRQDYMGPERMFGRSIAVNRRGRGMGRYLRGLGRRVPGLLKTK